MSDAPEITFIIPHKGREKLLIDTLRSISEQDFDMKCVEVRIVSQNSTLSPEVRIFHSLLNLSIINRPVNETISALRNFGVARSGSEYLAFIDADIYLSPDWLHKMLTTLNESKRRVIVSAMQHSSKDASPLEKIRTALSNPHIDQPVDFLPGRNLFLKRSTFDKIGGFPEKLTTCEDYYFTNKASKLGDLYYTSNANYIHLGEDNDFSEMLRKEIWRGQSNLLSISGREIPLAEIPSFIVPIGLFGLLITALTAIVLDYMVIALISVVLFLVPVVMYSMRLYFMTREQGVPLKYSLKFYLYYFPARAIGTIAGIFKSFKHRSHS